MVFEVVMGARRASEASPAASSISMLGGSARRDFRAADSTSGAEAFS